ncbi:hypothetical protein SAMN05444380_106130 [Thermophagus xiamenensis]|uniref:Uncharacterized protein n=1 Tax=Thermophagus xiamenensis TaxID=385682 RepID=A0A1I1XR99_9BACT|nr:hypothetical protein SAMN05444380_106130 [Thermophagus xiamenensis]
MSDVKESLSVKITANILNIQAIHLFYFSFY